MSSPADMKKRLDQNWIQFLKANSSKLSLDSIAGSSPPSVFVGHYGYPRVTIGPMIPPLHGDTSILDRTELWAGKTIDEIANYRLSLVRGTLTMDVHETFGRYLEDMQELAMSKQPAESEATFEKKPLADIVLQNEIRFNTDITPFGPSAPIKTFKTSSLSADKRIERTFSDTDLRASDAIMELYRGGVEISSIHKVLSVGMLGLKKKRKLVPTRWSVSATDDNISRMLVKEIEANPSIDLFEVTRYSHLANNYSVILLPCDGWSFEMIESWFTNSGRIATGSDYEDSKGLDHYPSIAGAFFAARLAVVEHLSRLHRKAASLVLREIHPEYVMPLGVWQVREGVREALKKPAQRFESIEQALYFASAGLSMSRQEFALKSKLLDTLKNQLKMTDFVIPKGSYTGDAKPGSDDRTTS